MATKLLVVLKTWQVFRNIFLAEEGLNQHIAGLTEDQR